MFANDWRMPRFLFPLLLVAATAAVVHADAPTFVGSAQIEQDQSDPSGKRWILLSDLKFIKDGQTWITKKGDKTDGASIPRALWTLVGSPFTGLYVRAALIHDHYCQKEHRVRTWEETHLMFYDAMIAGGVDPISANTMYYGVYCCGPKWAKLAPGVPCGRGCIMNTPVGAQNFQPSEVDETSDREIEEAAKLIKERAATATPMTLEELRQRANERGANPFDARGNFIQ